MGMIRQYQLTIRYTKCMPYTYITVRHRLYRKTLAVFRGTRAHSPIRMEKLRATCVPFLHAAAMPHTHTHAHSTQLSATHTHRVVEAFYYYYHYYLCVPWILEPCAMFLLDG